MARKSISKKIRFEIFKRDAFSCQYCGKSAPDVILHIDPGFAVNDRKERTFVTISDYQITLNMHKFFALVCLLAALLNATAIGYFPSVIPNSIPLSTLLIRPPEMSPKITTVCLVVANKLIDSLMADAVAPQSFQPACDLFRTPVLANL